MTDTAKESAVRSTIDVFYQAFAAKDIDLLRTVVTDDWEYIPEPPGVRHGPDQMIPAFEHMARSIPDMQITILDLLIHGDRVGVRADVSGTQAGELFGVPATSKQIRFAVHSFHELRGNLIAKTWHIEDWFSAFRQIGTLPASMDQH